MTVRAGSYMYELYIFRSAATPDRGARNAACAKGAPEGGLRVARAHTSPGANRAATRRADAWRWISGSPSGTSSTSSPCSTFRDWASSPITALSGAEGYDRPVTVDLVLLTGAEIVVLTFSPTSFSRSSTRASATAAPTARRSAAPSGSAPNDGFER